jgi:methylated-DNA-protein-cysteine methyltransferase related protein
LGICLYFTSFDYSLSVFPKIHAIVLKIPKGKVATYGQVAAAAGFPGAARQVVWALRSVRGLPWHRVLGAGGKIRLPGESGFEQKMRLQNEGVAFVGERVRMDLHQHEFPKKKARAKARAKRFKA